MFLKLTRKQEQEIYRQLEEQYLLENIKLCIDQYKDDKKLKDFLYNIAEEIRGDVQADINYGNLFVAKGDIIMNHIAYHANKFLNKNS